MKYLKLNKNNIFLVNFIRKNFFCGIKYIKIIIIFVFSFNCTLLPLPILAGLNIKDIDARGKIAGAIFEKNEDPTGFKLFKKDELKVKYTVTTVVTAYNSDIGQCDDSPCITANGFNVCEYGIEDTVAINSLKFGTKIKIPNLFGDRIFVVRDRMNKRYSTRMDIWMKRKIDAKTFGIQKTKIDILEIN